MTNAISARFKLDYPGFGLDVSLDLPGEGATVVFGPSGCGKTTLLRCMAGLERAPDGLMRLDGEVWQDGQTFLPVEQRAVGMVFQEPRLFPHLNVKSNLCYGLTRVPEAQRVLTLERVVGILGIEALLERRIQNLSGGEKQRVAIGRALLRSPRLLLMDEPLSALDVKRKREILPFLQRLRKELKIPIVYVTHSLNEVLQLVDTLVVMEAGKVAARGPAEEVFSHLDLRSHLDAAMVGAVLETRVAEHDPAYCLTRLDYRGQNLFVPKLEAAVGDPARLHILSQDVSLALDPPNRRNSILNVLKATVVEVGPKEADNHQVDVKLDAGGPLLATITKKSFESLKLKTGTRVFAQIKAVKTMTPDQV